MWFYDFERDNWEKQESDSILESFNDGMSFDEEANDYLTVEDYTGNITFYSKKEVAKIIDELKTIHNKMEDCDENEEPIL